MKKIGVIISTNNGKNKINYAIQSILNQTYKNYKIVICDDGSTDGTYEYLIELYCNNNNIMIIKNTKKMGLAFSLNRCIDECNDCEYIARMDDDDLSLPNRFYEQVKFLEKNNDISFVGTNIILFDGLKVFGKRKLKEYPQKKDLIWNSAFVHPSIMFKKNDLIRSNCYRVSTETTRGQDYDLWMRMYSLGFRGANIQKYLFRYTENKNTAKKRSLLIRLDECKIRYKGYKLMKVNVIYYIFVLKPFISYIKDLIKK